MKLKNFLSACRNTFSAPQVFMAFMAYCLLIMLLLLSAGNALAAKKQNFFIITGPEVTEESFQRFVFSFSVDSSYAGKLFVRVFDADFGGTLDLEYKDSKVRYLVYGGANINQGLRTIDEPLPSQSPLAALELGEDKFYNSRWRTIAALNPTDGRLPDGRILFQLVVEGISGPGSNKFQLFISGDEKKNTVLPGLRLFAPAINVQVPSAPSLATEVHFTVPATSQFLNITNFDADTKNYGGRIAFSSPVRPKVRLKASNNKTADYARLPLLEEEKGKTAALLLSSNKVNYVQLWLEDDQGKEIPLELPPFLAPANHVPEPKVKVTLLSACNTAVLDATGTVDKDDDQLSFFWDFEDGSTDTGSRITHDFNGPGIYTARLTVQDDSGFVANQASLDIPVTINAPPKARIAAPASAVPGEKVRFDGSASADADSELIRYRWIFDKEREDNGPVIEYSFDRPGVHEVRLLVEDDGPGLCTSDQASHSILINAAPLAQFTFKQVAAPGEEVVLDASDSLDSDGAITTYTWDFGEQGASGSGETVRHSWQEPGLYTIRLQVADDSGLSNGTNEAQGTIRINAAPEPVITASTQVAAANVPVSFSAAKSCDTDGKISAYAWNFGDGATGQGGQAEHVYAKPGLYSVRLTTQDDSGVGNASQFCEQTLRVNAPPVPVITMPEVVNSSEVVFDASRSSDTDDAIIAYTWDFGDGSKANGAQVRHVYPLPGSYTVQLQVTDASGTASAIQAVQQEIRVNAPPVADAGPDQLIAPGSTVQFDGSRSLDPDGAISSFVWQVQGEKYTGAKFAHQFDQPGQYQINLTVTDNDNASQSDSLTVIINNQPIARMQPLPRLEPGKEVLFDATGSVDADGSIAAYFWDFGDGSKGEGQQVKHVYAEPGRYQAVLTVQDDSGATNDSATTRQTVAINFPPKADAGQDVHTCGQLVSFDGSTSTDPDQDPLAYYWDFGDQKNGQGKNVNHQFAAPGLYPVRLRVDDQTGLGNSSDTQQITVQINNPPKAVIHTDGELFCVGEHVLFDGSLSHDPEEGPLRYLWDLGDGQPVEDANPIRVYDKAGDYAINLTVFDDSGLQCNAGQARKNIQLIAAPIARAGEDIEVCSNAPVAFDATASNGGERPIISYTWNFGDGSSDVLAETNHIYKEPGIYEARLTVKTLELSRCDNQASDVRKVRVLDAPQADFTAGNGCVGELLTFDASASAKSNEGSVQYHWNFGDGAVGGGSSTAHSYSRAGRYTVRLKASNPENAVCSTSESMQEIKINQPPVPRIRWAVAGQAMNFETPQAVLPNTLLHFSAAESKDEDGVISKLLWDFGNGQQAEGWFVEHSFKEPGRYLIRLTVEDDDTGLTCSRSQVELPVFVVGQPALQIQGPEQVCVDQEVRYSLNSLNGEAEQVRWDFGRGMEMQGREVSVTFPQAGIRELHTQIDGQPGPVMTVQVLSLPELVLPKQLTVLAGEEVRIAPAPLVSQKTGVQPLFRWERGDGATVEERQESVFRHVYSEPGKYTVRLHLKGGAEMPACLAAEKEIAVTVLPPPEVNILSKPEQVFSGGARDEVVFQAELRNGQGNWTYHWDFGDKGKGEGATVSHIFQKPGTYMVTLTLIDGSGIARKPYSFSRKVVVQDRGRR
ncbi:MAG: PKD domain-containing protein [Candidatus Electrothrix aestuarii]|uniref:PKD domain-containing protein n=1 Tax=Candidatus Electrothrix aestuarii TaxID=3062594 RepID=A0AAU8LP97_9BACT|nr:PKD domain-containing protein [Candidatus Electrothrix aestuarii]